MVRILWSFLVCLLISMEGKGWPGDDEARNLANTCSGCVSFVGSKLMAMFGILLAAMVFGLVDAAVALSSLGSPSDRRLLGIFGRPAGPDCLQPYPGRPAAASAALMDATGMAAMGALCWAATMAPMFAATFFQPFRAGGGFWAEHSALHGVRVGVEGLERQLKL